MSRCPRKRRWSELSPRQRAVTAGLAAVQIGLLVAALADLRRRPAAAVRGGKRMWAGLAFVNYLGPIAYFAVGRRRTAG